MRAYVCWIILATRFAVSPALAQDTTKPEVKPQVVLELLAELQQERDLIPHCPKVFASKWSYFNVKSGKLDTVTATGASGIRNCHLMINRAKEEEPLAIPISMMSSESLQLLGQYVGYSKHCRQALANMVTANGDSPEFEWTDNKGIKHRSKVTQVLLQSESGNITLSPPKAMALFAMDSQALSADWIPWASISQVSREKLLGMALTVSETDVPDKPGTDSAFPRSEIPSFNQSEFKGGQSENCGPNAVANFVIWWDRIGLLPLPILKGDERDRAEWAHERLYGAMNSGGGTSSDGVVEGFKTYLARYYPQIATAQFIHLGGPYQIANREIRPFTVQAASELVRDGNVAILSISQTENGRPVAGHWVSVATLDSEGRVTLNTWGYRFHGKLKQLSESEVEQLPGRLVSYELRWGNKPVVHELVVENPSESMSRKQTQWFVMPSNQLLVIKPQFRH